MRFNIDTIQPKNEPPTGRQQPRPAKRHTRLQRISRRLKSLMVHSHFKPSRRTVALTLIAAMMIPLVTALIVTKPARASSTGLISSGKGVLAYGDTGNANNPRVRPWASGATSFGAEGATASSITPAQTVIKQSPTRIDEWMMAVADTSGNLQVLKSTDGGTTWSSVISSFAIGGTGTTRRFDLAYESNSGDGVLIYSRNATTNELGYRTWAGSSWTAETTYDPGGTANIVTWVEIGERANSDELAVAYLTNGATDNIGAFIWTGSSNTPGNATGTTFGTCDQTAGTPDGVDKCMDINYESASGRPVMSWGISSAGNTTNTIRASRWDGSAWTTNTLNIGATGDDGTWVDCESDPDPTSLIIACSSFGASTADVQAWTVSSGTLGVAGMDIDTAAHAASTGHAYVATTYLYSGSTYRAIMMYADAAADTGFDYSTFNGTTWAVEVQAAAGYATQEESMIAVRNGATPSQALVLVTDASNDLYAEKIDMDSAGVVTIARADSSAALETVVPATQGYPMDFAFEPARQSSVIDQKGYIFENDDEDVATGDAYDENTQLAAGNTAMSIQQGRRVNIRAQLNNSGGALDGHPVGLFYDKNDGYWNRVRTTAKPRTSAGSCDNTLWNCSTIDTTNGSGSETSVAIDPNGTPWISSVGVAGDSLVVGKYVGSGGSGCVAGNGWQCFLIDAAVNTVGDNSIAMDSAGNPWISYFKGTGTAATSGLDVARYVGSGGTGCSGTVAWSCSIVLSGNTTATKNSLAFDRQGNAWVAYATSPTGISVAKYSIQAAAWTNTLVDATVTGFSDISIAFDNAGLPWIAYYDANASDLNLRIARNVGTGGSGCTGGSSAWTCTAIDTTGDVGKSASIAMDPNGYPWVAYGDVTNTSLKVARYDPAGGYSTCAGGVTDWDCVTVDNGGTNGAYASIAFDPSGKAWIAYNDDGSNNDLWTARYVGGSAGTGCTSGSNNWTCASINTTGSQGHYPSIAFDRNGKATISYQEYTSNTNLRFAQMAYSGEILMAPTMGAAAGDPLNESHADMTATTDTTNRDTANCISTGTWNNGAADGGRDALTTLRVGGGTAGNGGCSETEFTIDTSQAVVGTTYRFVLAIDDSSTKERSPWHGPSTITQYPTITVTPDGSVRYGKSALYEPGTADCTADTSWTCGPVSTWSGTSAWNELAYDAPTDTPWLGYYALNASAAKYVGGGTGSGCGANGSTDWLCWSVDAGGQYLKSAVDPSGNLWMAYYTAGTVASKNLGVAKYVGGGKGTGCSLSTDWTCWLPDQTGDVGNTPAITFGPDGNPTISEFDGTNNAVKVVRYVGTGGNCAITSWSCYSIDAATNSNGHQTGVVYDDAGTAWIAYRNSAGTGLKVAQFVGGGGAGCTLTVQWNCVTVDTSVAPINMGMGMGPNGPAVTYGSSANILRYANYVGSGGGCTSAAWNCINVMNNGGTYAQNDTSVSFDATGNPWIAFFSTGVPNSSFLYARYLGGATTGSGCGGGLTTWSCVPVTGGTNSYGQFSNILFNTSGEPMVAYGSSAGLGTISFARKRSNITKSYYDETSSFTQHNGVRSDGQWRLTSGRSPATSSDQLCGGVSGNAGYCAVGTEDGSYDSLTVKAKEKAMYTMRWEYPANAEAPGVTWVGKSTLAPSTASTAGDLALQVYRFGTTNAWEDVATDTASTDCTVRCSLTGMPVTGAVSDYYEASGSVYFAYFRLIQRETTAAFTLSTDSFKAEQTAKALRGGQYFRDGQKTPLNY